MRGRERKKLDEGRKRKKKQREIERESLVDERKKIKK